MTTLYRPVPIKTAEQAEALPEEAIIVDDCGDRYTRPSESGTFWGLADDGTRLDVALAIGNEITALVPIEAEEECQDIDAYEASGHMRRHHLTRYTTPWEAS